MFAVTHEHEQVTYFQDASTGLRAIVAVHSTACGPALGGTRFFDYSDEASALRDVLALSKAMTYKNALAGLDHGGGKAVIWGDPTTLKSEALLLTYGRFIHSLAGRYITACDVGTYSTDMDIIARETSYVTGRTLAQGGAGDSSVLTAFGVFQGMRAAAQIRWGSPDLASRRVGISGVGKVGTHLVDLLIGAGASPVVSDIDASAVQRLITGHPDVSTATDTTALIALDLDIYAPCALGGAITSEVIEHLSADIVCGGANNQLASPDMAEALRAAGVLYAPDFLVNAGGVIQVADELEGFSFDRARAKAAGIFDTCLDVLRHAESTGTTTAHAAEEIAERRIAKASSTSRTLSPARSPRTTD